MPAPVNHRDDSLGSLAAN